MAALTPSALSVLADVSTTSAVPMPSMLTTPVLEAVYNNDRDAEGRLDSSPLRLGVTFGTGAQKLFEVAYAALMATKGRLPESAAREVLASLVVVEVVLEDGHCPLVYSEHAMVPVPRPAVEFGACTVNGSGTVTAAVLRIRRELPLSSSHGMSPMRFVLLVGTEILVTHSFLVHSRKSKTTHKVRRARPVPQSSPRRLQLLSDFLTVVQEEAEADAVARPTKMPKL